MPYKNSLVLTIFLVLSFISLPAVAMKKPAEAGNQVNPKQRYVTLCSHIGLPTPINGLFQGVKVQTNVEIAPESTREQVLTSLNTSGQAIRKKEDELIEAYCTAKQHAVLMPSLKAFLNIHPTAFYIEPEKNKLVIRQEWYKCNLAGNRPVYLETRLECLYDPETASLTPGPLMLYIFPQDKPQKYMCVSMARLRAIFPEPDSLKITPENQEQKKEESRNLARANIDVFLAHGQVHESPDPDALYNKLYFLDLKAMAEHLLAIQDIPTVD